MFIISYMSSAYDKMLMEKFGMPIGTYAGEPLVGVRDERRLVDAEEPLTCAACGMMPIAGSCGCDQAEECPRCGMMPPTADAVCSCTMSEAKKGGPSKKTAKKILRGTKTFKEKMKKVEKWADDPAAAAAWMMHRAYGKWPAQKK